jgi:hypothetical protein
MYQLAHPRYEGPLRRRWRNRTTFRGLSLAEVWRWRVGRTADDIPEDLPSMVEGAVLRQDMDWVQESQWQPSSFIRSSATFM